MKNDDLPDLNEAEIEAAADGFFDSVHLSAPTNWRKNEKLNDEKSEFKAFGDELEMPAALPDPHGVGFSDAEIEMLQDTANGEAVKLAYGLTQTPEMRELVTAHSINEKDE